MRELHKTLAGVEITLAATFKASLDIADRVGDPLTIAREANVEALMLSRGLNYDPKWRFTVKNIPQIIHIGMLAADSKKDLSYVQELVFEAGFVAARDVAIEYLALIVGPSAEESFESEGGKPAEK